uniref:Fcf2 pre-rRNA processing C-terminal domain-containing protein n=1 Tax=Anopheles farauti TaxID=69004 RepID=A0A182QDA8_9DIPT
MDLFVIDTVGDTGDASTSTSFPTFHKLPETYIPAYNGTTPAIEEPKRAEAPVHESDDDEDYAGLPPPGQSISKILEKDVSSQCEKNITTKETKRAGKNHFVNPLKDLAKTNVESEMQKAVLTPSIEKKEDIARLAMSDSALRKLNRLERHKTKGKKWFDMSAPEMTPELQNELTLLKMRSVLDPKQSFKRIEKRKQLPKYFEMGKVIDSPLDHFNERGVKKLKSKSLIDELMADAEFQKFNKRKYAESLERQKKKAYHKAVEKMKREKKRSKKK